MTDAQRTDGVWVARYGDHSSVKVFATEIDALRCGVTERMDTVTFVPYGEDAASYIDSRQS